MTKPGRYGRLTFVPTFNYISNTDLSLERAIPEFEVKSAVEQR